MWVKTCKLQKPTPKKIKWKAAKICDKMRVLLWDCICGYLRQRVEHKLPIFLLPRRINSIGIDDSQSKVSKLFLFWPQKK